jgi:flagellar hook-length control protein FliK
MNTSLANLTTLTPPTPRPPVSDPVERKAPERPSPNRDVNDRTEDPRNNSRQSEKNERSDKKNTNGNQNDSGNQDQAMIVANVETPVDVQVQALVGSTATFATVLQTAGMMKEVTTPAAVQTKEAIQNIVNVAMPAGATEGKISLQEIASVWTPAQLSQNQQAVTTVDTVTAETDILQKALDPMVQGEVKTLSEKGNVDQTVTLPTTEAIDIPVITPKAVIQPELATQVNEQSNKTVEPDAKGNPKVLQEASMTAMQATPAANMIGNSIKSNSRRDVRGSVAIRRESSQQAKVSDPASRGLLQKQMGILSQGGAGRQGRFVVKESVGNSQVPNTVVGEAATASVETTATQAIGNNAIETASPVKQISEAFQSSAAKNGQEIVVRLDPPHLGKVSVTLRLEGGQVRGVLEVESPRTLSQLQREAPNIITRLTDAGIDMKRMELSLSENGSRDSMRDSSWFSQQYNQNEAGNGGWDSSARGRVADETLVDGSDMVSGPQLALSSVGDDSINIWI